MIGKRKRRTRQKSAKRGIAAVETALVLPFLLLLIFGYIEIGWYINSLQTLHDAARKGAREAASSTGNNDSVRKMVLDTLESMMEIDPEKVTVEMYKLNKNGSTSYEIKNLSDNEIGEAIQVKVTVDYSEFNPPSIFTGLAPDNIASLAVMKRID